MTITASDHAVISQSLIAAAREMGVKLIRSAYSTIVRDANDASSALLDRHGHVVAQAELNAMHLGSISTAFEPFARYYDLAALTEDDVLITNHPYFGGQHLPDIFMFSPIRVGGELVGFAASVAHHIDVGGGAPGLNMAARELYQEGLIIPPVRFSLSRDWAGGAVERLFAENFRVPEQTIGDLYAQLAGNNTGIARVRQLCEKYGSATVVATMEELQNYAERRIRSAISEIPNGTFDGEDLMDSDGITDDPVRFKARVVIEDDRISVDFTGTSPQVRSNINAPYASTLASTMSCIKAALTAPDVPFNAGTARPIEISAPLGTILNPKHPAPVRARMVAGYRAFNAVMKALAQAAPERVMATGFDTTTGPYLSHSGAHGYKVYHEIIGGGYGASAELDGCSGVDGPMSNCSNAPVESLDMDFDYFRVVGYGLRPDSGGAGRQRGGLGIVRRYAILKDGIQYAQYGDRFNFKPEGLFGAAAGQEASCVLSRDGEDLNLPSKTSRILQAGDVLSVNTGGGAGYGPVRERSRDLVMRDLEDGYITPETARDVYGLEIGSLDR